MGSGASQGISKVLEVASNDEIKKILDGLPKSESDKLKAALANTEAARGGGVLSEEEALAISLVQRANFSSIAGQASCISIDQVGDLFGLQAGRKPTAKEVEALSSLTKDGKLTLDACLEWLGTQEHGPPSLTDSQVGNVKTMDLGSDMAAIGSFVADALKNRGWGNVDRSSIQVKDLSGAGGSKTYKVWPASGDGSSNITPAKVALHSRMAALPRLSEARTEAAAMLLGANGVTPKRLTQGVDWFIEPWEGTGQPILARASDMKVLGKELAKIHKLPTEWFTPFRNQLKEEFPCYRNTADGSHVWWYSCRTKDLVAPHEKDPELLSEYVEQPLFTCLTKSGSRIVTCHGDLHAGNMISLAEGSTFKEEFIQFVDLEFTHVAAACHDLGYVTFHYEDMPVKDRSIERDPPDVMRRAFLESYLEAMGEPSATEDVDALLIDATLGACGHHFGPAGICCYMTELEPLRKFKQVLAQLVTSKEEQASFHEKGPEAWFAKKGYASLLNDRIGTGLRKEFKFLDRIITSGD